MIACHEAIRRLWDYLDEVVDVADRGLVEEHLSRCQRCCGELEFAGELRRMLATSHTEELPGDVRHRLHQILEDLASEHGI